VATAEPLISVIIPTLNEERAIASALARFDTLPGRWELIVGDSGSTDGTRDIAERVPGVRVLEVPRGRGAAMNAAATASTGDILLFLHADTALPTRAYALIAAALTDPRVSATGFHLRLDNPRRWYRIVWLASRVRLRVQRTLFGDQAIAVRRADFQSLGGYREQVLMEDHDLSQRLRRTGQLRLLPAEVVTSARRFERHGVLRTLALMTGLQLAYALGVSGDRLARWYRDVR
jgi:rSAM/selenodomain-associated transferase 2